MALQGTLDTLALPDVLRLLAATRKTGRLRIDGQRGTGSVWVVDGEVAALEAVNAPHASDLADALFELLRFEDGSFVFDPEVTHDGSAPPADVEVLIARSEAMLSEWHDIEAVVPSLDCWVSLCRRLPLPEISITQSQWSTIVAVGAGTTVRKLGDELCLAELPISRAVKELQEMGLVEIGDAPVAPASVAPLPTPVAVPPLAPVVAPVVAPPPLANLSAPVLPRPLSAPQAVAAEGPVASFAPRARRATRTLTPTEPDVFVPLALPGREATYYDEVSEVAEETEADAPVDDRVADEGQGEADCDPADEATANADREADAAEAADVDEQPSGRGLRRKFLSAVKD